MKLRKEDKQEIVRLRKEGHTVKEISLKFNIERTTIYRITRLYNLYGEASFEKQMFNRSYSPDLKLEVIERVKMGESRKSLAIEYQIRDSMIIKWLQEYEEYGYNGLITKKRGRPKMKKEKELIEPSPLNNEERQELIELRAKNKYLEMENEYLKKLDALVRQRLKQERKRKSK